MRKARSPLQVRWDSGLCLLESVHASNFLMPWTSESFHKIIAPLRGQGRLWTRVGKRETSHRLAAGTIALVGAESVHRIQDTAGAPLHLYILCIARDFPVSLASTMASVRVRRDSMTLRSGLPALREIAAAPQGESRNLLRLGLTATLVARLLNAEISVDADTVPQAHDRVADFIRRLDTEFYLNRDINEAARETGVSRRRFTQLFTQIAGETYAGHVQRLRITYAKKLLREEGRSPIATAFECGYEDLTTFYRAFKRQTDMTPAQWTGNHRCRASGISPPA